MPHIHSKPGQHDTTASAFIVRTDGPEPQLLLHMHRKVHQYLQFGGHVELNENPWQTIRHEVVEEAGYDLSQLQLLQPPGRLRSVSDAILHPYPVVLLTCKFPKLDHFHTDIAYAFVTDQLPQHAVAAGESTEMRLVAVSELKSLANGSIPENVREVGLFVLETCLAKWERVNVV